MRVILYTGKGGVGKTSVAAATALHTAGLGYKTIVLSTDAAHSLADSFDFPLGNEPQLIAPNLWGQETDLAQTLQSNRCFVLPELRRGRCRLWLVGEPRDGAEVKYLLKGRKGTNNKIFKQTIDRYRCSWKKLRS